MAYYDKIHKLTTNNCFEVFITPGVFSLIRNILINALSVSFMKGAMTTNNHLNRWLVWIGTCVLLYYIQLDVLLSTYSVSLSIVVYVCKCMGQMKFMTWWYHGIGKCYACIIHVDNFWCTSKYSYWDSTCICTYCTRTNTNISTAYKYLCIYNSCIGYHISFIGLFKSSTKLSSHKHTRTPTHTHACTHIHTQKVVRTFSVTNSLNLNTKIIKSQQLKWYVLFNSFAFRKEFTFIYLYRECAWSYIYK